MQVILGSDAIHRPLTGIGRYALELARHLRQNPAVAQLDFFGFGRWPMWQQWSDLTAAEAPVPEPVGLPQRSLRSVLGGNKLLLRTYQALSPHLQAWHLRQQGDALFHSPNYFVPNHPGPKVATVHDLSYLWMPQYHPPLRVEFMARGVPKSLARADFLITDAESVRQEVIKHFAWPADKIAAVPLGVDAAFRPRTAGDVQTTLSSWGLTAGGYSLFVGTIEPRKNLVALLDAYDLLPQALRQQYPLVLTGGRGWNAEDIHARMARAAAQGWLHYLSFVPQAQLPLLYAGARLFVYPSHYEGFGLPPLEAMASGVPVVCSGVSSLPEVVGDAALLVAPQDVEALAAAMQRGLEDEDWRQQAVAKGLARAGQLTWQACAENTIEVYKTVMACALKK